MRQVARHINRSGSELFIVPSLEELADYSPKDVEIRKLRLLKDPFKLIVLECFDDIIHIVEDSYIALKHRYQQSGRRNYKTDNFIQSVDSMLILQ